MFRYHGWATIYADHFDEDGDEIEAELSRTIGELRELLLQKAPTARLEFRNVKWILEVSGCNNHRNE